VDEFKILSTFFFKKIIMQILTTSGGTINFIPRENIDSSKSYSILITSENENKSVLQDLGATIGSASFYHTYNASHTFVEGEFYMVTITNSTDAKLIFRDKIFCTNQAADAYQINDGVYKSHGSTNDFIYYE
tara:strand:+ start:205 stop:600 length:396 start_codon:yes stop_codon:yes gene_type:complete